MKRKPRIHYYGRERWEGDTRSLCGTTSRALRRGAIIYLTRTFSEVTCTRCEAKLEKLRAREMGVTR